MVYYQPPTFYQPISKRVITQADKNKGCRWPVGTQVEEYRTKIVYIFPSGKRYTKMKTHEEMRNY